MTLGARQVVLYDPVAERAAKLAERLAPHFSGCTFSCATTAVAAIEKAEGVVNATPVGMTNLPGLPFDPGCLHRSQWLADIIYFPLETELLGAARQNGQKLANGVSMVAGQAAEAFRLITGTEPDRARMLDRLLTEIAAERKVEQTA